MFHRGREPHPHGQSFGGYPASLSGVFFLFKKLDCMMNRRRPTAIPPSTPCSRCRKLESAIRAVMISVMHFLLSGFHKVHVWHHSHHVIADFWTRQSRPSLFSPSCLHLLVFDDKCMLSVPSSTSDLHNRRWHSGEIFQVLPTGDFTLFCHVSMDSVKVYSPFFSLAHAFVSSMSPVFSA